jgi:uncharacterized membrane protein
MARDFDRPTFKMRYREAIAIRLRFNYLWIVGALILAWVAKLHIHPVNAANYREVVHRATIGPLPGIAVCILVGGFLVGAIALAISAGTDDDEVYGNTSDPASWRA